MLGHVYLDRFRVRGRELKRPVEPGRYARSHVICHRHHSQLDGLDGNARDYFRNLMLLCTGEHITTGRKGKFEEIRSSIDGRQLERWFRKLLCGAVHSGELRAFRGHVPVAWLLALFDRQPWPDQWTLHTQVGHYKSAAGPQRFAHTIRVAGDRILWVEVFSFGFVTSMLLGDEMAGSSLRPREMRFRIQRGHGGEILEGVPAGTEVGFDFTWPPDDPNYIWRGARFR